MYFVDKLYTYRHYKCVIIKMVKFFDKHKVLNDEKEEKEKPFTQRRSQII